MNLASCPSFFSQTLVISAFFPGATSCHPMLPLRAPGQPYRDFPRAWNHKKYVVAVSFNNGWVLIGYEIVATTGKPPTCHCNHEVLGLKQARVGSTMRSKFQRAWEPADAEMLDDPQRPFFLLVAQPSVAGSHWQTLWGACISTKIHTNPSKFQGYPLSQLQGHLPSSKIQNQLRYQHLLWTA